MRLYEGSVKDFRDDVIRNAMADKLANAYRDHYRRGVSKGEIGAWQQSFNFLKTFFDGRFTPIFDHSFLIFS